VTVVNGAALSGGTQSDAGTTVLQGSSTLTGTWGADTGRTLRNEGTFTWSAGVLDLNPLYHAAAANNVPAGRFINTGTFLASGNALTLLRDTSHNIYDSNGKALFENQGSFLRFGSTNQALLTISVRLTNSSVVSIESGRVRLGLDFTQGAGSATLSSNLVADADVRIYGGTFTGLGTVAGQFLSAEQSSFGTPLGAFIAGSFTNWPFATLHLKLGGNNAGTNQDQLRVTGPAGLAGNLSLSFADGFTPAIGQSFTVMTYTARSGAFTNLAGPVGYEFQPVYTTTNLILNAVFFSNVPPVMTLHPSNRTVFAGATVRFDAAATGTEPLNWQWLRNNTPIAGATNAWFEVPSAQAANAGAYRVDVSNLGGFASSSNALLTVLPGFTLGTNFNLPVSLPWTSSTLQNSQVGYLAGPNGTILATYNGGATWTNIGPNVPVTFHNVQVVDGAIYAFGSNGHICVSYDGGQTWQLFPTGTSQTFYGGHFTGIGSGWAVGSGGTIYQLTNNAWVPHGSGSFANFQGVWSSGGGAWAVGSGGSICRYWNGGWYCGSYGGAGVTFYGVSFWPGGLHGLAVGSGGTIYRTGDGGISWFPVASGTGANLTSVTTVSYGGVDYAWIGGSGGTLLFSANGGGSWSSLGTGTSATITSVTFRDGYGIYTGADGSCNHFTFAPIPVNLPPAVAMLNQGILVTNTASGTLNNLACVPLTIFAVAADPDGVVTNLEFTVAARYATNNFAPRTYARRPGTYSFLWVNDLVGEFLVRAVATDNRGATAVALPLTINAIKGPPQTLVAGGFFTTNGSFKLCMCADTNAAWTLLANQDLNTTNWVPLGPMTYTNDLWRFFDLDATNYTYRFYRARRD
jgi:hypothetical protein